MEGDEVFSDRVCNPYALHELVYSSIGSEDTACKTPPKQRINVSKRLLEFSNVKDKERNSFIDIFQHTIITTKFD